MIACARPARFGRGEQTLMDLSVRDTWEITPDQVMLTGLDWDVILAEVAAFYADCRHGVRPVRTGYRVTFTCNLLLDSDPAGEVRRAVGRGSPVPH